MSLIDLNVRMTGHERIDFDRKKVRKALRASGRSVQKEARRMVARRAVSAAGEAPGRKTGELWRSIKVKVSKSGFLARVSPFKTAAMGKDFYPAYLFYGVRKGAQRKRDHKKQGETGSGWRIDKRDNYMTKALDRRRGEARAGLEVALRDALVPR